MLSETIANNSIFPKLLILDIFGGCMYPQRSVETN
jgi:hypothetical protein